MKCQECIDRKEIHADLPYLSEARWMLYDEILNRIVPLCETHWNEYCHMEGEDNLTFQVIENTDEWLRMINEQFKSWEKRYTALLNQLYPKVSSVKVFSVEDSEARKVE